MSTFYFSLSLFHQWYYPSVYVSIPCHHLSIYISDNESTLTKYPHDVCSKFLVCLITNLSSISLTTLSLNRTQHETYH